MSEGGAAVIRSVLRTVVPVLVAVTSLVASACGGGSTLTAPTPTTIGETPVTTSAPATTEAPSTTMVPSTTVPASTSMAPSTSVTPTTSLAGGPIPEAMLDQISLYVSLEGNVLRRDDQLIFKIDPDSLKVL